jgi:glycosyltransferase involved in cell wall biosynthesis
MRGRFNVLYAGTIGPAQNLKIVLDAAALLQVSMPDAQFVLAGNGLEYERLRAEAATRKLTNIRFLGRLPGVLMPALYACADVLMLHLRADPLFAITIPHKVFTYLAAGKPILVGGEGDSASLVTGTSSGLAVPPDNPEAIASAVIRLHSMPQAERETMGKNGRQAACQTYGRTQLVKEISRMLQLTEV